MDSPEAVYIASKDGPPLSNLCNSYLMFLYLGTLSNYRNLDCTMDLQELYERCAEDTALYRSQRQAQTEHCFELMRQALMEDDSSAFTYLYRVYAPQVRRWVFRHPAYASTDEPAEYFVSNAFTKFYFASRHENFDKFANVASALAYLKACVHSSILQYVRQRPPATVPLENVPAPAKTMSLDRELQRATIWERINALLPDETDRRLAHLTFSQGLKPAAIVEANLTEFSNARSVSVALQRIRRRLRKDPQLRALIGASARRESSESRE